MAMYLVFTNQSGLAPVSDYRVDVYVNNRIIAGPFELKGHKRDDGWLKLVEQFITEQNKAEVRQELV